MILLSILVIVALIFSLVHYMKYADNVNYVKSEMKVQSYVIREQKKEIDRLNNIVIKYYDILYKK